VIGLVYEEDASFTRATCVDERNNDSQEDPAHAIHCGPGELVGRLFLGSGAKSFFTLTDDCVVQNTGCGIITASNIVIGNPFVTDNRPATVLATAVRTSRLEAPALP
jgi:hypothetical protein